MVERKYKGFKMAKVDLLEKLSTIGGKKSLIYKVDADYIMESREKHSQLAEELKVKINMDCFSLSSLVSSLENIFNTDSYLHNIMEKYKFLKLRYENVDCNEVVLTIEAIEELKTALASLLLETNVELLKEVFKHFKLCLINYYGFNRFLGNINHLRSIRFNNGNIIDKMGDFLELTNVLQDRNAFIDLLTEDPKEGLEEIKKIEEILLSYEKDVVSFVKQINFNLENETGGLISLIRKSYGVIDIIKVNGEHTLSVSFVESVDRIVLEDLLEHSVNIEQLEEMYENDRCRL